MQQCRWSPMLIFRAWATCGLNNKFSWYERGILLIDAVDVFRLSFQGVIITGVKKYKSKEKRRERKKILSTSFSCKRLSGKSTVRSQLRDLLNYAWIRCHVRQRVLVSFWFTMGRFYACYLSGKGGELSYTCMVYIRGPRPNVAGIFFWPHVSKTAYKRVRDCTSDAIPQRGLRSTVPPVQLSEAREADLWLFSTL